MSTTQFIQSLLKWLASPGQYASQLGAAIRSAGDLWSSTETQSKLDEKITTIQAGENISINFLDPYAPIINAQGVGFGDVVGPSSAIADNVPIFSDASGKRLADSGVKLSDKADTADLAAKAAIDSPEFTGTPTAPTAAPETDTDQIATTAFVAAAIDALPPPGTGDVSGPASSADARIAVFDGTTGKTIKDGGKLISELQPADVDLTAIAALTSAANKLPFATGTGTWAMADFSAFGRTLVDDADAGAARTTLGVVIGTDVQAYDVDTAKTDVAQQFSKPQRASSTALTSATTITPDLADSNDFSLTLGHNATLANPTNQSSYVGLKGSIACVQDGTGGRTLAFGSNWYPIGAATAPAAPTGANAKFRIDYHVVSSTRIDFKLSSVGV